MNIELKRFTTNARLSQETIAFAADVWVDGKKVGRAENAGHGGATMVHLDPSVRGKVEAYGKALIPAEYANVAGGAEWLVDQLVDVELAKKFDKRIAKTDAKQKAAYAKKGFHTARFSRKSLGEIAWTWFAFAPGTDPKTIATEIAAKAKATVADLVVL